MDASTRYSVAMSESTVMEGGSGDVISYPQQKLDESETEEDLEVLNGGLKRSKSGASFKPPRPPPLEKRDKERMRMGESKEDGRRSEAFDLEVSSG
jgi:hypothetical protein